jgi:hypothetical protein
MPKEFIKLGDISNDYLLNNLSEEEKNNYLKKREKTKEMLITNMFLTEIQAEEYIVGIERKIINLGLQKDKTMKGEV